MRSFTVYRFCFRARKLVEDPRRHVCLVAVILSAALFAGCAGDPFATGRDARTFNPATGQFEWPDETAAPRPVPPPISTGPGPAVPEPANDRPFNPATGRFESPGQ